jgi:hypothetical protein
MPAKTPATATSTAGYVDPQRGYYGGELATTETVLANATKANDRLNLIQEQYYFDDVDDTDTWTSGIAGIKQVAWIGNDVDVDVATASLTTAATGVITFQTSASNIKGWVVIWIDPAVSGPRSGYPGR